MQQGVILTIVALLLVASTVQCQTDVVPAALRTLRTDELERKFVEALVHLDGADAQAEMAANAQAEAQENVNRYTQNAQIVAKALNSRRDGDTHIHKGDIMNVVTSTITRIFFFIGRRRLTSSVSNKAY